MARSPNCRAERMSHECLLLLPHVVKKLGVKTKFKQLKTNRCSGYMSRSSEALLLLSIIIIITTTITYTPYTKFKCKMQRWHPIILYPKFHLHISPYQIL